MGLSKFPFYACKIRDNKLSKYYNMDFGKGELQREFEVNSRSKENTERAKEQLRQSAHRGTEMPDRGAAGANIGTFLNKLNAFVRELLSVMTMVMAFSSRLLSR